MLTKEKVKKLMEIKGEIRGNGLKEDADFILESKGEKGLEELEARMVELGCPVKYREILPMNFYPIALDVISLIVIKEMLNLNDKEVEKMGASAVKFSLFMKVIMKYFVSLKSFANQVSNMWRRYYTTGNLEMPEFSEESKYMVLRLKNFKIHPIYCNIQRGYFSKIAEMLVKSSVTAKETKCVFRGDEYTEFLLTW
jgi:hypothetical protein